MENNGQLLGMNTQPVVPPQTTPIPPPLQKPTVDNPDEIVTLTNNKTNQVLQVKRADLPSYGLPSDYISQADTYAKQVQAGVIGADSPNIPSEYRAGMLQALQRQGYSGKRQAEIGATVKQEAKDAQDKLTADEAASEVKGKLENIFNSYTNLVPSDQKGALNPKAYLRDIPLVGKLADGQAQEYNKSLTGLAPELKDIIVNKGSGLRLTQTEIDAWKDLLPNTTKTDAQNAYDISVLNNQLKAGTKTEANPNGVGLDPNILKAFGVTDKTTNPKAPIAQSDIVGRLNQGGTNDIEGLQSMLNISNPIHGLDDPKTRALLLGAATNPVKTAENMAGGVANMFGIKTPTDSNGNMQVQMPQSVQEWGGNVVNNAIDHPVNTALAVTAPFTGGGNSPVEDLPPIEDVPAAGGAAPQAAASTDLPPIKTTPMGDNVAGQAATRIATPDLTSVTKSEQMMQKALQTTDSNTVRGIAKELEGNISKVGDSVKAYAKSIDNAVGGMPVDGADGVLPDIRAGLSNESVIQSHPDIATKVEGMLGKSLKEGYLSNGREATNISSINEARMELNKSISNSWFANGMPTVSPTDIMNATKWAYSNALKDVMSQADQSGFFKRALDIQHTAYEAGPALSKKALTGQSIDVSSIPAFGKSLMGKITEIPTVMGARKLQGATDPLTTQALNGDLPPITAKGDAAQILPEPPEIANSKGVYSNTPAPSAAMPFEPSTTVGTGEKLGGQSYVNSNILRELTDAKGKVVGLQKKLPNGTWIPYKPSIKNFKKS